MRRERGIVLHDMARWRLRRGPGGLRGYALKDLPEAPLTLGRSGDTKFHKS